MILPYDANLGRMEFSERTPQALEVRLVLASETSVSTAEPSLNDPTTDQLATTTTITTLPWTAPIFAAVKGIVHMPFEKPAMKPESREALLPQSLRPGDGSMTSGSGGLLPSPRSPNAKAKANGISACWHPSPSCRPASSRRSSMASRLQISRSLASPEPCRIRGPSRSRPSGSCNSVLKILPTLRT